MKFGRTYLVQILTPQKELVEIAPPFSVEFDITRNTLASTNTANLTIYNLGPSTRNRIFKDRYSFSDYWQLIIWAGYDRLEKVFQGNIYQAMSYKQRTDWITEIEGYDGLDAVQNGFTARTVPADTPKQDVLTQVISDMPNVLAGFFGSPAEGQSGRGQTLVGNSAQIIEDITGGNTFIDNEIIHVIDRDEVFSDRAILLDQEQLFMTPKRRDTFLDVDLLFLPTAAIGQVAEVRSREEIYNGQYKIVGFKHMVQISSASAGDAKTSLNLDAGAAGLREVG